MGTATQPRGRLPQRVYWVRRGLVLLVAFALVFAIGKLLGGGGDDTGTAARASTAASTPRASTAQVTMGPMAMATGAAKAAGQATKKAQGNLPLAAPSGPCSADEVSVVPSLPRAWAGGRITIDLDLQGTQPACTFSASPETLVVKITSGADRIWSTQDCPRAIPTSDVVVRSGVPTTVPVTWSGRRSDDDCTSGPAWALPGYYHVYAAAMGSAPADVQFRLTRAATRVVTRTPTPSPSTAAASPTQAPTKPSARPTPKPTPEPTPSGSVSGKGSACGGDNAAGTC